jgi:hydroxymethylglutaryl-CoA reductase
MTHKTISGFSKLSKRGKIKWIVENFFVDPESVMRELSSYWHSNEDQQKILDGISENTISNYPLPLGVAPNFVINGKTYAVPMVTEESSVVAAASSAAKFWMKRGGFKASVTDIKKVGQLHFLWPGSPEKLRKLFPEIKEKLTSDASDITREMEIRGGGVLDVRLRELETDIDNYHQIFAEFDTCDSMGANFVNSVIERFAETLEQYFLEKQDLPIEEKDVEIIMRILSNFTPDCIAHVEVSCPIEDLGDFDGGLTASSFAKRFCTAVRIAEIDTYRATTHNKGIFNGVDAVVLATANDFRAVEACGHTWASRDGKYSSLSHCSLEEGVFKFWIDLPLAVGTVGGLTSIHPIAKRSLELLGNPDSRELMMIIATVGLAQNFAALRSLVTTGIQKGHMKMHLPNILNHMNATDEEKVDAKVWFEDNEVSFSTVRKWLVERRIT